METGAQNGIDNQIGLADKFAELVFRWAHNNIDIATSGAPGNMARQGRRYLIGLNRAHHINVNILLSQDVCSNPAVPAVIAKSNGGEICLR